MSGGACRGRAVVESRVTLKPVSHLGSITIRARPCSAVGPSYLWWGVSGPQHLDVRRTYPSLDNYRLLRTFQDVFWAKCSQLRTPDKEQSSHAAVLNPHFLWIWSLEKGSSRLTKT